MIKNARWSIILIVMAAVGAVFWLSDNYLNPPVKAAIAVHGDQITIQNLNRIKWKDPTFTLDDGAKLTVRGDWAPQESRTLLLSSFQDPKSGKAHDMRQKKGFSIMIFMSGFTTTVLYDWAAE